MKIQKLDTVDAFIVFDIVDADASVGAVRLAPKILRDGAKTMARSLTYQFASFSLKVGGASVGINAHKEKRTEAMSAFVDDVEPLVRDRRLLVDPGKGVTLGDLEILIESDVRSPLYWSEGPNLRALGVAQSAKAVLGDLNGRSVAIEGFDSMGAVLAAELGKLGAKTTSVSTPAGTVIDSTGIDPGALREAWDANANSLVDHLGGEVKGPGAIVDLDVDAIFVGSKIGIIDHVEAANVKASVVVPTGPVPVTAKALAVLRSAGVVVLPDFITTAGALFAAFPPEGRTADDLREAVVRRIPEALKEVIDHPAGPLLGACERAEEFLSTWQQELPFGRPLA